MIYANKNKPFLAERLVFILYSHIFYSAGTVTILISEAGAVAVAAMRT